MKKFSDWLDTLGIREESYVVMGTIGVIYFLIDGIYPGSHIVATFASLYLECLPFYDQ